MNTYEVVTDQAAGNYYEIQADDWRWERPGILASSQTLVGTETMLVFLLQGQIVAQFRSEHLIVWHIKQN